jgi:hypothetical protein
MPYDNLPESEWANMDKCVKDVMAKGHDKKSAIAICYTSITKGKEFLSAAQKEAAAPESFAVFKQAKDGAYRWVAFTSSSYQDRDKEIVSQKALEADTARMNATGDYGALDWYHTPIVIGACDFSAMHGNLSIESGTFKDNWIGERIAAKAHDLAMSRSFTHPIGEPDAQGVYHNIKTFSRAILPRGKESNLLTALFVDKEVKPMLADKIKEFVTKLGGDKAAEEKVAELLASATATDKAAEDAQIAHKEATPPAPETTQKAAAPMNDASVSDTAPAGEPKDDSEFVAALTANEFSALIGAAVQKAIEPLLAQATQTKEAQVVAMKESSVSITAEIAKIAQAQAATQKEHAERLAALEGATPRKIVRASQDAATIVTAEKAAQMKPHSDTKAPSLVDWIKGAAEGVPPPPQ